MPLVAPKSRSKMVFKKMMLSLSVFTLHVTTQTNIFLLKNFEHHSGVLEDDALSVFTLHVTPKQTFFF